MLDSIRYYLGLLTVATTPWAILYWYLIHPFVGLWRRVGPTVAYIALGTLGVVMAYATWAARDALMVTEYGTGPVLQALAAACYLGAITIEIRCRKYLSFRILVGLPELSPQPGASKLLTEGIYGKMRHPRYVGFILGLLAASLFVNYLAMWVVAVATVPGVYGLTMLEERELRQRFGAAYTEYSQKVPRFIPGFG